MSKQYICRSLTVNDLERVMGWRMSPQVTQFMNTDPILTLEGQQRWFNEMSSDGNFHHWVINVDNTPCGVIYLSCIDNTNKRCTWGYYIAETKMRSFYLALALEVSLYDYTFDLMGFNKVIGESFCLNTTAIKMHELCGCKTEGILRQHILKNGQYYDICVQSMLASDWDKIRNNFDVKRINFVD